MNTNVIQNHITLALSILLLFFQSQTLYAQCEITNISLEAIECSGTNLVDIEFNLQVEQPENDFFEAWINDQYIGLFEFSPNNNYTIQTLQIINDVENVFTVCVNDMPNCCNEFGFVPECGTSPCVINDFAVLESECSADGLGVDATIFFNVENPTANQFEVSVNGIVHEILTLNPNSIYNLTNLPIGTEAQSEISICLTGTACCASTTLFTPDCTNQQCVSFADNGHAITYSPNTGAEPGDELPLINSAGVTASIENYVGPNGDISFQQMGFFNSSNWINAESMNLALDFSGVNGEVHAISFMSGFGCCFSIAINGEYYFYQDLFDFVTDAPSGITVSLTDYGDPGVTTQIVHVSSIDELTSFSIGTINGFVQNFCYYIEEPICELTNLTLDVGNCNAQGFYPVVIDFDYTGNTDSFNILAQSTNINFSYADLPITLSLNALFPASDILILDLLSGCQADGFVESPECEAETCNITAELIYGECEPDSLFYVTVLVGHTGPGTAYTITANGEFMGEFAYTDPPPVIGPLPGNTGNTPINILEIVDTEFGPNCSLGYGFYGPSCSCEINEFDLEAFECSGDGIVDLEFSMTVINEDNEFFEAFINDVSLGMFPIEADNQYSLTGIEVVNNLQNTFTVCVDNETDCCDQFSFTPYCDPTGCTMNDPHLEFWQCTDGILYMEYFFSFNNGPDPEYFEAYMNGNFLGEYIYSGNYQIIFDSLYHIPNAENELQICLSDLPDCCKTISFFADCPDVPICELSNPSVELLPCNADNTYSVLLDFDYAGQSTIGFSVVGNGQDYGNFQYESLPIELGPFESGLDLVWEFAITDQDNNNCTLTTEFDGQECTPNDCGLNNLSLANVFCLGDNTAILSFNLDIMDYPIYTTLNGQTTGPIFINSTNTFTISDQTIIPNEVNVVTICVNELNCCLDYSFETECTNDPCNIDAMIVEPNPCTPNGIFYVDLNFTHTGPGISFTVTGNGENYGSYAYVDLPVQVGPFAGTPGITYELIATDTNDPDCSAFVDFAAQDCGNANCAISNLEIFGNECWAGQVSVAFGFEVESPGNDFYEAWFNGEYVGVYPLEADNDYGLENIGPVIYNQENQLQICINDQPNCCETISFVPFCLDNPDCVILEQSVELLPCDAQGEYYALLDFTYSSENGNTFYVYGNGQNYGVFNYTDLPVEVGPFPSGMDLTWELIISDQQYLNCEAELVFDGQDCPIGDCAIADLALEVMECSEINLIDIEFGFTAFSPLNDFWDASINGNYIGTYPFESDNYYGLQGLEINSNQENVLTICVNDQPDCCQSITLFPECGPNNFCAIENPTIEFTECNSQGEFYAVLNFEYTNINSGQFSVQGNGQYYGDFLYSNLPVTVGPFDGGIDLIWELIIADSVYTDCTAGLTFQGQACNNTNCEITNIGIEVFECINQDFIDLEFFYSANNANNDFIDVFINNEFFANLTANANNYHVIQQVPIISNAPNTLTVCINDNPDCCATYSFIPECSPNIDCAIIEPNVELTECNSQGEFYAVLDFDYTTTNGGQFSVQGNGQHYGDFLYSSLPVTVGPFDGGIDLVWELIIADSIYADCTGEVVFEGQGCNNTNCEITNIGIEVFECINEDFIDMEFFYEANNVNNDFIDVFINNEFFANLTANANNYHTIQQVPINSNVPNILTVCINDNPNCCATYSFIPECAPNIDCAIIEPYVELTECNDLGEFYAVLNFEYTTTNGGQFSVQGNGQYYGDYLYSSLPVTVGPFDGGLDLVWELIIADSIYADCTGEVVFEGQGCNNSNCEITNIGIEVFECINQDLIDLEFFYEANNADNEFIDVFINNEYFANLTVNADNYHAIQQVPINSNAPNTLTVCINDIPECCATYSFIPDCGQGGDCQIFEPNVELMECNDLGEFYAVLNFDYVNPGSDIFTVFGNGQQYGEFNYNSLPVTVGPFESGTNLVWELIVADTVYNDCSAEVVFDGQNCNPTDCEIANATVELTECNEIGEFYAVLNFDYSSTNSGQFSVVGNGEHYGDHFYSSLPITLGPFQSGTNSVWELIVADSIYADCGTEIGFEDPNCQSEGECLVPVHPFGFGSYGPATGQEPGFVIPSGNSNSNAILTLEEYPGAPGTTSQFEALDIPDFSIYEGILMQIGVQLDLTGVVGNTNQVSINIWGGCCFNLGINGEVIYVESLSDLPATLPNGYAITVTPVVINNIEGNTITVSGDNIETFFIAGTDVPFSQLCYEIDGENNNCEIGELQTEIIECDNDEYYVILDFDYVNTSDHFILGGTLPGIDPIAYEELPLTMGPYNVNESNIIEVIDEQNNQCFNSTEIAPNPCEIDCNINDLNVELLECLSEGTYALSINFEYDFSPNEEFQVYLNEQILGNYTYGQLPINILNLQANEAFFGNIEIVTALDNCTLTQEIFIDNCENENCFNFNELEAGLTYQTGNGPDLPYVLLEQDGATVSLDNCGPLDFYYFEVIESPSCEVVAQGSNGILMGGASLNYDFTNWSNYPTSLTFSFCGETSISIDAVDQSFAINNGDLPGPYDMGNGYSYTLAEFTMVGGPTEVTIQGPGIGELSICGSDGFYGPVCYQFGNPPNPSEGCYGFENLEDGAFYTGNNAPTNFYNGDFLTVSPSDAISEFNFLGITSDNTNPLFNGANNNLGVLMGTLLFDFSETDQPTEFVNFDFAGTNLEIKVNEGSIITFEGTNTTDSLILADNGVVLFFHREAGNPIEGTVSLFGPVEQLWIAGEEVSLDNICYYFEIQQAEIWPGDINSNNIANHFDLLYLGIANGSEGPARNNPLSNWQGQTGQDWEQFFISNGINYKHADANGDGRVDEEDFLVLKENIGNLHGPVTGVESQQGTPDDPPIYVDLNANGPLTAGEAFSVPINLGTIDNPVLGLHGVAFSIQFDPTEIDPNTVDIVLDENSWMGDDLWILKRILPEGIIEVAITRKDQESRNGFGGIAHFIGIIDDLVGKEVDNDLIGVRAISDDESDILLYAQGSTGTVITSTEQDNLQAGLHVFPNPANEVLHVRNYNEQDLKRITIHNVLGQLVYLETDPMNRNELDISGLESGFFFIQLYFAAEQHTYKVEVIH